MSIVQKIYTISEDIECISEWNYNGYDIEKRYTLSNGKINTYIAIGHRHRHYELLNKLYKQRYNPDSQVFISCQDTIIFHKKTKSGTVFGWGDIDDDIVIYICDQLSEYKYYKNYTDTEPQYIIYNYNLIQPDIEPPWNGRSRNYGILNSNSDTPRYLDRE